MRPAFYVLVGVLLVPTIGLVGDIVTDGKFKSTKLTGAPLQVASDDMVANLNADEVDGLDASAFALSVSTYSKAEVDALVAAVDTRRAYYLTETLYEGHQPFSACAEGYHFASIFELLDMSSLRYAYEHPDALGAKDSGKGPPSGVDARGWVRTGLDASGGDNCAGICSLGVCPWFSNASGKYGPAAFLWSTFEPNEGPWTSRLRACGAPDVHVWCIED